MSSSDDEEQGGGLSEHGWHSFSLLSLPSLIAPELSVLNLTKVLENGLYAKAEKSTQQAIANDISSVLEHPSLTDRAAGLVESDLLPAVRKHLPKKRLQALQATWKAVTIERTRRARRKGQDDALPSHDGAGDEVEDEGVPTGVLDLPVEALSRVFEFLDPATCARASAVCRLWRQVLNDRDRASPYYAHAKFVWWTHTAALLPPFTSMREGLPTPNLPFSQIFGRTVLTAPALRAVLTQGGGFAPVFSGSTFAVTRILPHSTPLYLLLTSQSLAVLLQRCGATKQDSLLTPSSAEGPSQRPPASPPLPLDAMWEVYRRTPGAFLHSRSLTPTVSMTIHRTISLVLVTGNLYRTARKFHRFGSNGGSSDSDSSAVVDSFSSDSGGASSQEEGVGGGRRGGAAPSARAGVRRRALGPGSATGNSHSMEAQGSSKMLTPVAGGRQVLKFWDLKL